MKIGVDLDEVVAKLVPPLLQYLNGKYNRNITEEDLNRYDFEDMYGLSKGKFHREIQTFYKLPDFVGIKPVVGSMKSIRRIYKNHQLFAITARPPSTKFATAMWLEKYFPGMFEKVIYTSGSAKGDICIKLGIDYLIDDHIKYINEACLKGIKCLLMDRAWNREFIVPEGAKLVYDWKDIERELK